VTIIDNESIHRHRRNAWPTKRELLPAEDRCWKYVTHHGKPMTHGDE
jgi:hypothetical protein